MKKAVIKTIAFAAGIAAVSFLAACGSKSASADKEILIGSIHPLTGGMAYEGNNVVHAQQLAIDEINKAGGIKALGGRKLKLATGDSQGQPDKAASEAQRLIQEKVVALTGTFQSSATQTATQESERAKVPFVVTVAATKTLMERGFKYSFRIQPNTAIFASDFVRAIKSVNDGSIKTAVIIHENSLNGTFLTDSIKQLFPETGIKLLDTVAYAASTATMSSEVTKLQSLMPDLLVTIGYFQDQSLLMKELNERKIKFKVTVGVANALTSDVKFPRDFGAFADGIMDINYRWAPTKPRTQKVLADFKAAFNEDMTPHAIFGYTSVYVLADALERAGSTDGSKLRDALAATKLEDHILPMGPIMFDEKGENANAQAILSQIQSGTHKIVFPLEYADSKIVF